MSHAAFVSGASGFVGSNLVRELHSLGWTVHVLAMITGREPDITPEKAREELGYRFTPISTLIQDTVDWMKKKGLA